MSEPELIALAERLGSQPFLVFAALAAALVLALLVTILVGGWAVRHARSIWEAATGLWARLATQPAVQRLESRFPFVWKLMRRLTAAEYLVLHLVLGLALGYAAAEMGARVAILRILEGNEASLGVARRLGAVESGREPSERGGTFVVLRLDLTGGGADGGARPRRYRGGGGGDRAVR